MRRRTPETRYREKTRAQALYDLDGALERVAELEAAILKHRRDIWGEGPVAHPHDADLYAILRK